MKMAINQYFTVDGTFESVTVIEHSKFICFLKGVTDEADAKSFIESIRKKHSLATHNTYAYIADDKGLVQKFSDDGEPQGTAGLPMLEVLKAKKLFKVVSVVTRYFGGIKLGTGGLTRAYSGAVKECVESANIVINKTVAIAKINVDYATYPKLQNFLFNEKPIIISSDFNDVVSVKIGIVLEDEFSIKTFENKFLDFFKGTLSFEILGETYYPIKL